MAKSFPLLFKFKARDGVSPHVARVSKKFDALKFKLTGVNNRMALLASGTKGFSRAMTSAGRSIRNFGAGATLMVTTPLLLAGKAMVKAASDAEETKNKFAVAFEGIDKAARDSQVHSLAKGYRLAGTTAREFLSTNGLILQGLDFTEKKALDAAAGLVRLSVDTASLRNITGGAAQVNAAFTSALTNEREKLKRMGIMLNEDMVKTEASKMAKKGWIFATVEQAKALASLSLVKKRLVKDTGDFNRTMGQYANQVRVAEENIIKLKEGIGNLLLPFAKALVVAFNRLTDWLHELSPGAKKIVVVFAAMAAAIGPLLILLGVFLMLLPKLYLGFLILKTIGAPLFLGLIAMGFKGMAVAAAPIIAKLGLIVAAFLLLIYLAKELINRWDEVNQAGENFINSDFFSIAKWAHPATYAILALEKWKEFFDWMSTKVSFTEFLKGGEIPDTGRNAEEDAKRLEEMKQNIKKKIMGFIFKGGHPLAYGESEKDPGRKRFEEITKREAHTSTQRIILDINGAPKGSKIVSQSTDDKKLKINLGPMGAMQ